MTFWMWVLIVVFIIALWQIAKRILIPVKFIRMTELESTKIDLDGMRFKWATKLRKNKHALYPGNNRFFVSVHKDKVLYHSSYVFDTVSPIIRAADDIPFFEVRVRVRNGHVVSVNQTNLSKSNARLIWEYAEP